MDEKDRCIAVTSEKNANTLIDRFGRRFQLLASRPGLGLTRDELSAGLRSFPLERYVIFYRAIPNDIDVVRLLHSARDVGAQFASRT